MRGTLQILGCGTSTGVPVLGCSCTVCTSTHPKNNRTRTSAHVTIEGTSPVSLVIDTSSDFRFQALRARIPRLDGVLFTHYHSDHVLGLEDIRGFNFLQKGPIPVYGTTSTIENIAKIFTYIFVPDPLYEGGQVASVQPVFIDRRTPFEIMGVTIQPFPLGHGRMEVTGYRFGTIAYATDCNYLPPEAWKILEGVETIVLDGLRYEPHAAHFTIPQAIEVAEKLNVKRAILTHTTHTIDFEEVSGRLPRGVELAYDGLSIDFTA